ncbi:MAG TPA: tRNA (N6-isopentenyl adenosine(37)-C2)-methylthiotransferase MiaB [Nitrospiraceae bacterium]|nr:tRNA (N6-isopentenyl adenosine(37)-C2)-methylthiotransferase MiaB [Nitrospiraceae bacterium]
MKNKTRPYRVHIETFGCQMNEYDTELVRSLLKSEGFVFTADKECADVVLMNTCAIRENAHNKVYGHLAALKALKRQRHLVVGVLGCMAQNLKDDLMEAESIVDVLVGPDAYRRLPNLIAQAIECQGNGASRKGLAVDLSEYETYDDILPERAEGVNGWIAVMRGCDNFCTFCVVPYTRGRERSRDPEGIIRETEHLVAQGYKQVTLLGQNVNSYRAGDWDFARLMTAVADIPGIRRVRFTSPHPKDFPPALLEAVASHPNICKHIHLPLQSGNDRILELMNRTYSRKEYLTLVEDIRRRVPDVVLTTDIICGFCTETDHEFEDTYRLVQEVGYHAAYVFKYSERINTIAARKYPDDVPDAVKSTRVGCLVELQKRVSLQKNRDMIGGTVAVLVEGDAKKSSAQWMGRTDGNITVVWAKGHSSIRPGDFMQIRVFGATATTLLGELSTPQ